MRIEQKKMHVLKPNGNYEEAINVKTFEIKDGCLIIYQLNGESVGYNSHQWVTFTLQTETI